MRITLNPNQMNKMCAPVIGYEAENRVTEFEFDYSDWAADLGEGTLTLAVQRPTDTIPYPVTLTQTGGNKATWVISETDLAIVGRGEFQLSYIVDEKVKKSAIYEVLIDRSLEPTGDVPDPYISWFEQIIAVGAQATQDANRAEAAADSIKDLTAEANTLDAGSDATAEYDAETGVMTFGIPRGEKGDDGEAGMTPNIEVGNVETLETGQPAYANITGTDAEPRLNLGLPKGNTGDTGATGAPAGFGTVTATVDANTGTPSVDVTASGADTAKNFDFAFHNIKGETGDTGPQGEPGVVQDVTVNGTSVLDGAVAKVVIPEITKTVTGNPIVIDDADGEVKALNVELTPIQAGTPRQDSTVYNEPYLSKDSPSFNSEYDKLVGGTVAWNQFVKNGNFTDTSNWSSTNGSILSMAVSGNILTATVAGALGRWDAIQQGVTVITGHKLLICADMQGSQSGFDLGLQGFTPAATFTQAVGSWTHIAKIGIVENQQYRNIQMQVGANYASYQNGDTIKAKNVQAFDLTQTFGTTVADAIYALEQNEAGSGIAFLKSYDFFTKDYYPYNKGELISVKPTAHVTSETYPLAGVELRGIPKISNSALYYDGDTYESGGTVAREYAKRTFDGSEAWGKEADTYNTNGLPVFFLNINTDEWQGEMPSQTELANMISSKWLNVSYTGMRGSDVGNVFSQADSGRWFEVVQPLGTTLESFKDDLALNPVTVVWEKHTPTTETVTGFTSPQAVGSTESYTDNREVPIPVGHESRYADIFPISPHTSVSVVDTNGTDTQTVTVPLNDLYGGNVDVIKGQDGQETWGFRTLNGTESAWGRDPDTPSLDNISCFRAYLPMDDIFKPEGSLTTRSYIGLMLSDKLPTLKNNYTSQYNIDGITMGVTAYAGNANNYLYIIVNKTLSDIQSVDDLKAWLAENPIQVAYQLATPTPLTTDPTALTLYKGDNVVSSDGDMELTYVRNLQAVIDKIESAL